jgi:hyperosmotically inducible periplasmic protein
MSSRPSSSSGRGSSPAKSSSLGRSFLKLVMWLIVLGVAVLAVSAYFFGYPVDWPGVTSPGGRAGNSGLRGPGTTTRPDTERARERAAQLGKKVAEAGRSTEEFLTDGALTTKIKSKIALDDHLPAGAVHVSTSDHVVTLSGRVGSETEHQRALALARETNGVKRVIDHIEVR